MSVSCRLLVYYVHHCFLSAYWNFAFTFWLEKTVRQSAAPGGARCISSSIVSLCKDKDSRKAGEWNMMGKYNGSTPVWGCFCLPNCTSSTSFFCISRTMLNAGVCDVTGQRIVCSCFGLFGAIVIFINISGVLTCQPTLWHHKKNLLTSTSCDWVRVPWMGSCGGDKRKEAPWWNVTTCVSAT